jgi:hypothetical protein
MLLLDFLDWPASLPIEGVRRRIFSGNPPHAPYVYGWVMDPLGRHTTDAEKQWLRAHGFKFSGGKWHRQDPKE